MASNLEAFGLRMRSIFPDTLGLEEEIADIGENNNKLLRL